jgi:uncharacterized RDD family membrane protein YckC
LRQAAQAVAPAWKEEVNRRIAEHKERRANPGEALQQREPQPAPGSIAANAAARVAARYAKAPSYSEMLADEARAAVRAAEAASKAALDAQAVAESVLAGIEAASTTQNWEPEYAAAPAPQWTPEPALVPQRMIAPAPAPAAAAQASTVDPNPAAKPAAAKRTTRKATPREEATAPQAFEIRWDSDLPVREAAAPSYPSHGDNFFARPQQHEWDAPQIHEGFGSGAYEVVEPAQPIHANLIEFPRELVATRKLRPRRAEGPYAEQVEAERQLSIFEVEPWTISTEPEATGSAAEAAPNWVGPEWSGIELDEEPPADLYAPAPNYAAAYAEVHAGEAKAHWNRAEAQTAEAVSPQQALPLAPFGHRLLAGLVDFSLIAGAFVFAAFLASASARTMPSIKQMAMGSVLGFALTAAVYLAIFFTLAKGTPGMKYAGLEIRTFGGRAATREQRLQRMMALLVSVAPVGLGAAWALFDEQSLCWHDRLSSTYVRKG